MREVTIEFDNFESPSNNQIRSMNSWVYKRGLDELKKKILYLIGEGPWPKVTFSAKEYPSPVRKKIRAMCQEKWVKRRMVLADITVRRHKRTDSDNAVGGLKQMIDAFVRMGWMVDDHENWFRMILRPQVLGDPKVIVTLHIAETDEDEKRIKSLVKDVSSMLDQFAKKG